MSTCGLNLNLLPQIGLRLASSCDTQCHATPFYMFNSTTKEYEPYVNKLKDGDFTLLRADVYFSSDQQFDYYGRQVAYDGRIVNDLAPRVTNSKLFIQLRHSEAPSQGMYQPSVNRLQEQSDQLPMENRNPYVLNDHVQWYPTCTTSQQPAAPVNARYSTTHSTLPPEMAHLHPAAAQPFYRGNANCKP